ncbi:MAG: four helix bundle protein [Candidatus Marinimicrobia bacterium]|nr:four helix bundle protein [Candidatus Neomarinimicrobiota bacterium]
MRFLNYAQSSAVELKSLLYIIQDSGWISTSRINNLQNKSEEVKSMILGLIKYLKSYRSADSIKESPAKYYLVDNEIND